jgi:O-antigen ligase
MPACAASIMRPPPPEPSAPAAEKDRAATAWPLSPRLEWIALLHAGGLLIFASWAFDGNVDWARWFISWCGGAGALVTLAAVVHGGAGRAGRWLWPLLLFNLLVLISGFNPSFSTRSFAGESMQVHSGGIAWLPSSADPAAARRALWLFNGVYLPALNLALCVRRRRVLRWLMIAATLNALVLAVFGTVQKLTGAGLFFGLRRSPNEFFFSTFIYHNHWGAFAVLSVAAGVGLVFHLAGRRGARDFWHSPAFAGAVGLLFIAATSPLSESRAGTLMVLLIAGAATADLIWTLRKRHRAAPAALAAWLAGALALAAVVAIGVYRLDERGFRIRAELTRQQWEEMYATGGLGSRATLYQDTWRMARDQRWFGWGFDNYASVFRLYNTQKSVDRLPVFYAQAHSDWLQSLAETGVTGTLLIGLVGALPLLTLRRRHWREPFVRYSLLGCLIVLLYAGVEFPFECPAVAALFWINFFSAVRYARLMDHVAAAEVHRPASSGLSAPALS